MDTMVGQMIRGYLNYQRGWSQVRLARAIGISEKHMSQIVRGKVPLTVDIAKRIEAATGGRLRARTMLYAYIDDALSR